MPEPGDEQLSATPRNARGDRAEAVATLVALVWASTVAIVFAVYGGNVSLVGLLAISPFIAAAFARPSRVALVGILTRSSPSSSAHRRTLTESSTTPCAS